MVVSISTGLKLGNVIKNRLLLAAAAKSIQHFKCKLHKCNNNCRQTNSRYSFEVGLIFSYDLRYWFAFFFPFNSTIIREKLIFRMEEKIFLILGNLLTNLLCLYSQENWFSNQIDWETLQICESCRVIAPSFRLYSVIQYFYLSNFIKIV